MLSIVLEDLQNRQIRFLRVSVPNKQSGENHIKIAQLGYIVNNSNLTASPLIKFRSVSKINQKTGRRYQVAVAVRENGRVEFYSDFVLVNEYMNPKIQCVNIDSGQDSFNMKFVEI